MSPERIIHVTRGKTKYDGYILIINVSLERCFVILRYFVWIFSKNLFLKFINDWKPNITAKFLDIFMLENEYFYT